VLQILATGHQLAGTVLLGAAIVLAFFFVVGGRSFCSWVCPVNLVSSACRGGCGTGSWRWRCSCPP
jgi:ferredoxin-type protein NapH